MSIKRKESNKELTKRQVKYGKIALVISIIAIIVTILLFLAEYCIEEYRHTYHKYTYEIYADWTLLDEIATYFSNQDQIIVYDNSAISQNGEYYNGAALIAFYTNYDAQDRVITGFNVYIKDIVEDNSSNLACCFSYDYQDDLTVAVWNNGWGSSGEIAINYISIEGYDTDSLQINLKESSVHSRKIAELDSGEISYIPLYSADDFEIHWDDDITLDSDRFAVADMQLQLVDLETGTVREYSAPFCVSGNKVSPYPPYEGVEDVQKNYVIIVDTSAATWEKSYKVFQPLPGGQTIRIPILIMPNRSCSMSIEIEFETLDGETIKLTPLIDAEFQVPYFESYNRYIDGKVINLYQLEGTSIVYFPFERINSIVIPDSYRAVNTPNK